MSNLTDFFPSGGGGGLTPKFQEFNASGTFTPTQALIDAGGYIEVFLVAGGGRPGGASYGGSGGEALIKKMYLTSVNAISIVIGGGGATASSSGGNSSFSGLAAGGIDVLALGGAGFTYTQQSITSPSWMQETNGTAGNGLFGYGAGGMAYDYGSQGIYIPKQNSGQGGKYNVNGASGYCLINWYE